MNKLVKGIPKGSVTGWVFHPAIKNEDLISLKKEARHETTKMLALMEKAKKAALEFEKSFADYLAQEIRKG